MKKLLLIIAVSCVATGCIVEDGESYDYEDGDIDDLSIVTDEDIDMSDPEPLPWRLGGDDLYANSALSEETSTGGDDGSDPEPLPWIVDSGRAPQMVPGGMRGMTAEPNPVPWK